MDAMTSMTRVYERLAAGECVPMREGKRARPTGPAVACPKCKGGGTVVEEHPAPAIYRYLEANCSECWGTGKHVPFVIEPDPMMLAPWTSADLRGVARSVRETLMGQRVSVVENDDRTISVAITPTEREGYRVFLSTHTIGKRGQLDLETWQIAIRLADAELRALGYRET